MQQLNDVINTELKEEHDQTLKFKNAFLSLNKVRDLYISTYPVEKGFAYPSWEVGKLYVADCLGSNDESDLMACT